MKRKRADVRHKPIKSTKVPCIAAKGPPEYSVSIAFDVDLHGYPLSLTKAGGRHYGVIRGANGDTVTVRATTFPSNDASEQARVTWPDGSTGETWQVSRAAAARIDVTATYRGASDSVTLWVIWAALTIDVAGNIPARCGKDFSHAVLGSITTNANVLGTHTRGAGDSITGTGRICVTAVLSPPNLHTVMQDGRLRIRRFYDEDTYKDGVVKQFRAKKDDTVNDHFHQLSLNDHEEIFDLDAPTFAIYGHVEFATETYMNFTQWVEFASGALRNPPRLEQKCSADATWHFIAEVLGYTPALLDAHPNPPQQLPVTPPPNITMPRLIVGVNHIHLPAAPRYTVHPARTIIFNDGEKP